MNDINLEKAFLERFVGAVLRVHKKGRTIPESVGSMVDPEDEPFCKLVRFKFQEKPLPNDIASFLREYYEGIGWKHNIHTYYSDVVIISGSVWPAGVSRCLCPAGIFEKDKQGAETNIFCYSINSIIG
jgi:hypothetical protein